MSPRRRMSSGEPPRRRKKFTLFSWGIWPKPRRITTTMARQLLVHPADGLMAKALAGKKNQSTKPHEEGRGSKIKDRIRSAQGGPLSSLDPLRAPSWAHHQSIHRQREQFHDHRRNDRQSQHHHRESEGHQGEPGDHQSQSGEA